MNIRYFEVGDWVKRINLEDWILIKYIGEEIAVAQHYRQTPNGWIDWEGTHIMDAIGNQDFCLITDPIILGYLGPKVEGRRGRWRKIRLQTRCKCIRYMDVPKAKEKIKVPLPVTHKQECDAPDTTEMVMTARTFRYSHNENGTPVYCEIED